MKKIKTAILGPGNIGADLMYKIKRSTILELAIISGIYEDSEGLALAQKEGFPTSSQGISAILNQPEIKIVFDATGAQPHREHAPLLKEKGMIAIDLTPAAIGPYAVPALNNNQFLGQENVNLITCGGQATIPIIAAINEVAHVAYAEIVATISSKSAGPGTRNNIDEFTQTTAKGIEEIGGADKGKAIIILNPAEPPILMRNTIYTQVVYRDRENKKEHQERILRAVQEMEKRVQGYVPGFRVTVGPIIEKDRATTMIEVEGAGDYLPKYAGNLDIITAAAVALGEQFAQAMGKGEEN